MQKSFHRKLFLGAIHVIGWAILFTSPFFFTRNDLQPVTLNWYLGFCSVPLSCLIIFYWNYFSLIENILFKKKITRFILINLVLLVCFAFLQHGWQEFHRNVLREPASEALLALHRTHPRPSRTFFLLKDVFLMGLTVALGVAIKMTGNWYRIEREKQELEKARAETELQNLKNQLNPHFLFNTLNNIYSLVAINPDRAQFAIHDLSQLLRHVLYDTNQDFVPLEREFSFTRSYIELMSLRLPKSVRLDVSIPREGKGILIAPQLFITLVENAFKHGVSNLQDSFIRIHITLQTLEYISCRVENSYFPQKDNDRNGSGIGIQNLQRRLQLLYPGRFNLKTEQTGNYFVAQLIIYFQQPIA